MTQDYYEILQVHPRADQGAIAAAYARLRDLYDSTRLEDVADVFADLAREKRDAIERAYAVLGDPARRAAYDAEQADHRPPTTDHRPPTTDHHAQDTISRQSSAISHREEQTLDYRPLPPAGRAERGRGFDAYPRRAPTAGRQARKPGQQRRWIALIALAGVFALVVAISVAITSGETPPTAPTAPTAAPLDTFEADIAQARQTAEQNPNNAAAWSDYGDALYNSAEILRENAPDSQLYQQRLPRWLEATAAYTRALALEPDNAGVRADLGVSACFYGAGTSDQSFVRSGTAEALRAAQEAPNDPRVLLNLGHCLVSAQPPQPQEAIELWKRVIAVAPPGSSLAAQAQQLIATYSR
jgi:cytochrome c-type biogenesis protein CcmH/NrfG